MNGLLLLAVLPGLFLVFKIYKMDKIESEPIGLIVKLLIFGAISIVPTICVELIIEGFLEETMDIASTGYLIVENFIGVALIEEFFKRFVLKKITWKNKEFNYMFDAIVYSVSVSMGFAILENVLYVFDLGLGTALMRMVTAIPAHALFAVFMGHHYGLAKMKQLEGDFASQKKEMRKSLLIPTFIHGLYDVCASIENDLIVIPFIVLVIIINVMYWKKIKLYSDEDVLL